MMRGLRAVRVLACVAACLLLLCAFYIAAEAGHDCHGDGCCPVCAHMRLCLDMLQSLLFTAAVGAVFAAAVMKPTRAPGMPGCFQVAADTLVSLRVRLDN